MTMKRAVTALLAAVALLTLLGLAHAEDGKVSFNKASVEQLMAIEMADVPEELAKAIVRYREENGPFKTPEELAKVPGMTQDYLEELNPQQTEDGDIIYDPDAEPALAPSKC